MAGKAKSSSHVVERTPSVIRDEEKEEVINQIRNLELDNKVGFDQRAVGQVSQAVRVEQERRNGGIRYEPLPVTDLDKGTVGWQSEIDPAMPFNFSRLQKWTWIWLLSAITLLTPFATSILSPAINIMDADFGNENSTLGSMTVTIYLLGYVVGPIFIGPLSEIHGRKMVLCVANAFFCLWQIGCALAPNIEILIVSRFFSGVGGAACLSLGGSIIGDMFRPDNRGFAIGMWNLGPLFGPVVGPLLGGFVTQYIGWRWDFWIVLAAASPVTLLIAVCTRETCHKVIIEQRTAFLRKELGRDDLASCYNDSGQQSEMQILRTNLLRPLNLIVFSPIVLTLSLYISFVFGLVYLLYTTIPTVFEDKYGFNTGETGFPYISLGLGNVLAWLLFTIYSDKLVIQLAQANQGTFTPEMRLILSIPFGLLLPLSLFWYGWSSDYNLHWASTIISLVPFGFGIVGLFLPISTYIVDSYPIYAASATSANVILRSVTGALLPLAGPSLYGSLGLGWGNSLLGFIAIVMAPLPFVFYKFGARLRKA
ncbi:bicyclomycin resistance protein, putative [Talaromyces stipitatus ATCC 10500]|uniref:Bicyclomycin resistance protein, putative n=1 Tax=Talaromyces stipitatus (strain ATCC 10500 / CBS 375.48 / QM 6759 / NRRL 1006) TaxID=441959 RepID=B8M194_TALSN|nr:bicyclomycin resistance protein, putative [Talaromyces stipitatus ATCC 10500]EED21036.1 bicyclomycin resistance protein, putative [Talaromyces stipitatus ATCC 10500]